jgi:hypothetical protein
MLTRDKLTGTILRRLILRLAQDDMGWLGALSLNG